MCASGYVRGGAHSCQADGSFTGGSCDPQPCTSGLTVAHASSGACSGNFGDVCTYACESGYTQGGAHTCGVSGSFSGGSCQAQPCTAETPSSATAACTGVTGDTCTLRCQAGFQVSPAGSVLTCSWSDQLSAVDWTGDAACAPRECLPRLISPDDGSVDTTNNGMFPSTATFSCNAGYARQGADVLTCQASGAWSASAPTCVETCANAPCQHGAECSDGGGTSLFHCQCPVPIMWEGDRCDVDVNECETDNGGCDVLQGIPLSQCSNSDGSFQCNPCDPANFEATLPQDPGGTAMQTCCYAPTPGDHNLPCDATNTACVADTVSLTAGCIGPPDATKSRPTLSVSGSAEWSQELTMTAGPGISVGVVAYDIHDRVSTLPRAEGAGGGPSAVSTELSLSIRGPDQPLCVSPSSVCSPGYCRNGGTCTPGRDLTATCSCPLGISGPQCDVVVDPCADGPCGNGECIAGLENSFCCLCPSGLAGADCSIETAAVCNGTIVQELCCGSSGCAGSRDVAHFCTKECAAVALAFAEDCVRDDTYVRIMETLHGVCNATACSSSDACSSAPCTNGGTCRSTGMASYVCVCDSSWSGEHCETPVPECGTFTLASDRHVHALADTSAAGDYTFSIRLREAELLDSPTLTLQTYPAIINESQSVVDLGYNISEAGRVNSFWVTPRDQWANVRDPVKFAEFEQSMGRDSVTVDLDVNNHPAQSADWQTADSELCVWEPRADAFMCAWFAQRAGNYSISVSVTNSLRAQDMPLELLGGHLLNIVPGPYDDTKTAVDPPPSTIVAGVAVLVNLTAYDSYYNIREHNDTLDALVQPTASTNLSWAFVGERYEISFTANISVEYLLSISLGDSPVLGSPYTVGVRQANVDLEHSEVGSLWGCVTGCLTMPDATKSVDVIVRDRYHNVRDDLDAVVVQVGYTYCTVDSCETTSVNWNEAQQAYNVSFALHSPTEYTYSITILVNTELLRLLDYHYAFHSNLNASMCATADCGYALEAAQFVDQWSNRDSCVSAGCLYQAAVLETVTFYVDAATSALYSLDTLQPALLIEPRCETGRTSPLYWKDESYCTTASTGAHESQHAYRRDGLNFFVDFTVERPGLYTLSLSLQSADEPTTIWTGIAMDIEIQPGPPSPEQTTLSYHMSAGTGTPLEGVQYDFDLQVLDANSNSRFGLEEVLIELRMASISVLNPLSQAVQPTTPYVYTAATPRIAANVATDDVLSSGSTRAEHSFNITLGSRGVFELTVWACPGDRLDLCNTSETPIGRASPLQFTVCQSNSVIEGFTNPDGFVDGARLHECLCDTGFFGDAGGYPHSCLPCEGGSYTSEIGQVACTECDAGYSCDCNSVNSKIPCGVKNEAACSLCQACGIGRYQDLQGQTTCNECPDGFDCPLSAMTFPVAMKGYWISADGSLDRHDCAVAGHMPDACPGGDTTALDDYTHCYRERHDALPDECKPVLGSVCNDGYYGNGCTKCCKLNEECAHLQSKQNPETGQPFKTSWYFTESEGRCKECPEQDVLQLVVFGIVGALFVADKLIKFAEVRTPVTDQ